MNPSVSDENGRTDTRSVGRMPSTLDIFAAKSAAHRDRLSPGRGKGELQLLRLLAQRAAIGMLGFDGYRLWQDQCGGRD